MFSGLDVIVFDAPAKNDVVIHPIADLHYGAAEFNEARWARFVESVADKPNHYFVIVGDLINNATRCSVSDIYRETCSPSTQKRWIAEQLKPIKDKILCGVGGNHERRSLKDVDDSPMYDVFAKLDIEDRFREDVAFVIFRIGSDNSVNGKYRPTYTMCVTHGAGNGMYIGSSANRAERFGMAIDNLDILVTGHTHKPLTYPAAKLKIDTQNKQILQTQFTVVTATSWLDYGGYPVQKMLTPTAHRPNEIWLSSVGKEVRVLQ